MFFAFGSSSLGNRVLGNLFSPALAAGTRSCPLRLSMQAQRHAREPSTLQGNIVQEEALRLTWEEHADCHVHGKYRWNQAEGEELDWCDRMNLSDQHPCALPLAVTCTKGTKSAPNQDNFSVTYLKAGYTVVCCMDGHGPDGHLVALRTVQTVPFFVVKSASFPHNMEKALSEAFECAHKDVVDLGRREDWDVQGSGSTAIAAVWSGSKVWIANTGDSRCAIGTEADGQTLFQTLDHKPDHREEKRRIFQRGGHVVEFSYPDGHKVNRMFLRGQNFPGLSMSRSFGDQAVKDQGVIATPDVSMHEVDLSRKPFLVLGTDGVWEFLDTEFVVTTVAEALREAGAPQAVDRVRAEAKKAWTRIEGDHLDDITALVVRLGDHVDTSLDSLLVRERCSSSRASSRSSCASQCLAMRLIWSQFSERVASLFTWDADLVSEHDSSTDEEDYFLATSDQKFVYA